MLSTLLTALDGPSGAYSEAFAGATAQSSVFDGAWHVPSVALLPGSQSEAAAAKARKLWVLEFAGAVESP